MKFVRFGNVGTERAGAIDTNGQLHDLSAFIADITPATIGSLTLIDARRVAEQPVVKGKVRFGAPVANIGKIIGIGMNYRDHCEECGYPVPVEPILFSKAVTSLCGPDDDVVLPRGFEKVDWEVEVAVVIGRRARYLKEHEAKAHIAGVSVINDISERVFQLEREGQWFKGKGCDTFAPLGPWLVTLDEVPDLSRMPLWLKLNGTMMQNSSTAQMVFGMEQLVAYVSQFMTLEPGDVIATGTPPGVGLGMKPHVWLKPGDVMELGVEGLGVQRQHVLAPFYPA